MDAISEQISTFILTELVEDGRVSELSEDTPLLESEIIDSLGILKILSFLDEAMGVDLSSDEIKRENFATIGAIRAMVERQKK